MEETDFQKRDREYDEQQDWLRDEANKKNILAMIALSLQSISGSVAGIEMAIDELKTSVDLVLEKLPKAE